MNPDTPSRHVCADWSTGRPGKLWKPDNAAKIPALVISLLVLMVFAAGPANAAAPVGVMVPAYFYPEAGGMLWPGLSAAATRIPLMAILNPGDGPGTSRDTDYVEAITNLQSAGGQVIGYVATGYTTSNLVTVKAQIDSYLAWYAVDGIFLDETTSDASEPHLAYYAELYQFIKARNPALSVVCNPGTQAAEENITRPAADTLVLFEDDNGYPGYGPDSWVTNHAAQRFVHLAYAVSGADTMTNYVQFARQRNAGWVYITDDDATNPWDTLPGYWLDEVGLIQTLNLTSAPFIGRQPLSHAASAGSNTMFSVVRSGTAPVTYQWFYNGAAIASATNAAFVLSNVQPARAGCYLVVVSNSFGSVTSQVATLTVEPAFTRVLSGPLVSDTLHSRGAAWGDYNNDGHPDLAVANSLEEFLFLNNGDGTFTRVTNSPIVMRADNSVGAAWGDFNNDGWLDLLVSNNDGTDALYRNLGNGAFVAVTNGPIVNGPGHSAGASWADYDRDGWLDLFIAAQDLVNDNLYRNNRDGTFTKVTSGGMVNEGANSQGCVWGDYDNDGWPDLFVAASGTNYLYHNEGGGNFRSMTNLAPAFAGYGSGTGGWADYDNDGDLDLLVANVNGLPDQLFRNEGGTNFLEVSAAAGLTALENSFGCSWADIDNDGFIDFHIAAEGTNLLYRNTGTGTFVRVRSGPVATDTGTFFFNGVWADYDGNGFPDLFVTTYEGAPNRLYRNDGNSHAWLKVRCKGVTSNRSAIGAKVRVLATIAGTNRWQMREISGGDAWGSQNDLVQIFGLGDATNVLTVRVEWPSGKVTEWHNVAPRQTITVGEPVEVYAAVNGRGLATISPQTNQYFVGQSLTLTATPRNPNWTRFLRWSDGNTNAIRTITVGLTNVFTALFTNFVALEELPFALWQRTFGGNDVEYGKVAVATPDGGFLVGGTSYSNASSTNGNRTSPNVGNGTADYWVVKLDAAGNIQWDRALGGIAQDFLYGISVTPDGGYILAGESASDPGGNKTSPRYGGADCWVVKLDASGNKQWDRSYGGNGSSGAYVVRPTIEGGYIIGGYSAALDFATGGIGNKTAPNRGLHDIWIIKTDAQGNMQWDRTFGGGREDGFAQIRQTADGGYFIGGNYRVSPASGRFWSIKLDGYGNTQWSRDFTGSDPNVWLDSGTTAEPLADGGYFIGGAAQSGAGNDKSDPRFGDYDWWFLRLDAAGAPLWNKAFGGSREDWMANALALADGGFVLGGHSASTDGNKLAPGYGSNDFWVVRLDANGGRRWEMSFGGDDDDQLKSVVGLAENGLLLTGHSFSPAGGNKTAPKFGLSDYWVVRMATREAPVGTPVVLVNGQFSPSNSFSIPATNATSVTLTTTFPGGYIYYSLDGVLPVPGEGNTFAYSSPGNPGAPFVVSNSVVVLAVAYSSDETGNVPADADPVAIHIVPLYNLTNTTPGGGSVAMNPPGGVYLSNTVVTITATPSNGWTFLRWEGAVTSTNSPLALTMDGAKTIRAVFGTGLTTTTNVAGTSVALWPPAGPYPYGSLVRLVGMPSAGNRFNRWFSNINGPTTNTMDLTVQTANTNIPAFFTALTGNNFTLTTLLNGYGTVTRSPAANFYASNTAVTLTAVPDAGRVFAGWSGDASGTSTQTNVPMNANKTVTATFTAPPAITLSSPANGAVVNQLALLDIAGEASDLDGSIQRVEILANGDLLATLFTTPFLFEFAPTNLGTYLLMARAVDNLGATAVSAPVSITVTGLPPVITTIAPSSGPTGSVVNIYGMNFHPHPDANVVFFGPVRAPVISATRTQLSVTVPAGATHAPVSVTFGRRTGVSRTRFLPTFPGTQTVSGDNFVEVPALSRSLNVAPATVEFADLDGDGRPDALSGNYGGGPADVFRNTSSNGVVSFAVPVGLPTSNHDGPAIAVDLDGDGRLDVVSGDTARGRLYIHRNISAPGSLTSNSFAPYLELSLPGSVYGLAAGDLDGDGRPDLIVTSAGSTIWLVRNLADLGRLITNSFAQPVSFSGFGYTAYLDVADLNLDGRPDIIIADYTSSRVSVLRNFCVPGVLASNSFTRHDFAVGSGPRSVKAVDFDGDGRLDLAVACYYAAVAVLQNTSTGANITCAPVVNLPTSGLPSYCAVADFNGDGRPDIAIASDLGAGHFIYPFIGTSNIIGSGSFGPRANISAGMAGAIGLAAGDLDGDGRPDLALADWSPGLIRLIKNNSPIVSSQPPVLNLITPSNGAIFNASANIYLNATATDIEGIVTNVSFFAGMTLIGSITNGLVGTNTFSLTWSNVPAGSYTLTAVAMDNSGLSATSSPVNITVNATGNQPPLASLIAPTNGAVFAVGENITLTASAVDPDGSVARVEFYHGGTILIGIASNGVASQFSVVWSNAAVGTYSLTARAFDNLGAAGVSEARSVTVLLFGGPPAFRFEQAAYSVGEGETNVVLRVIRNFSSFATVNFATSDGSATAGADYDAAAGQLTFQPGVLVQTITNRILEDLVVEGSHTFSVTLSLPNGGGLASPSSAVVTIIDNDVQSGSSFLSIVPPPIVNTNDLGTLRIYLTGEAGLGQWRLPWERSWRNSGTAAGGLQPGFYEIEFKPVSGHLPPPPATLAVSAAQETRSTNAYTILINTPAGSLTVFIDPPAVATNADPNCRGQWRVNGGAFQNSGATVTGLPAGSYAVEFKGLSESCGWSTPATRDATVRPGVSNSFRVSYVTNVTGLELITALTFNSIQNSYLNRQPFSFVGQITTEFGEASGVVVKERVVLTAAHVVFDDYSLAWAGNAQWFFQRHAPDYNPAPQEVRGYYVNAGYAAQREAEGTPGVSQTASFDLDVAALYFYEAAGRGGYGGYLVSDAMTQWLQAGEPKALVGYPVEGIAPANLGKMHTVGPTTLSFQQTTTTGAVFTCAQIRGLPGNSGGPLCVRYGGNNYYYPAGIYVGGSDRAIVRAIDSRAVEVINLAELTSNLGTNQSGGVIRFGVILPPGTCYQAAYVLLQPAAARLAGAQWQVHYKLGSPALSPWTSSSTTAILLNNKPDYLDLAPAEGFLTPDTTDYTLGCVTTNLVFTYVQVLPRLDPLAADGRHLVLSGITNRTYRVEYNGRIGVTNGWSTLTNITFTANNNIAVISNALHNLPTNRFYRAVRVP